MNPPSTDPTDESLSVARVRELIKPMDIRTRVIVLQHPQERDRALGTVPLLQAMLPKVEVIVGLSWPSLARLLDDADADALRWAVLYPGSLPRQLHLNEQNAPVLRLDRNGNALGPTPYLEGLLVLDGSWSQAKTLWWRNPWLLKVQRLVLHPKEPSIYGKLRKEPRREAVSTLESVADALVFNGEPREVRDSLRRVFRTMVQRARDEMKNTPLLPDPEDDPSDDEGPPETGGA
nr:DTW domain-containing protein [Deltaproteobacteria bacterium]